MVRDVASAFVDLSATACSGVELPSLVVQTEAASLGLEVGT